MKSYEKSFNSLLKLTILQIFLFLVSLPILISWGIPVSLVSFFSTPLFSPLLMLFLVVSSVIFFLELLGIPNTVFIVGLEYITRFWLFILSYNNKSWLVGFAKPPLIVLGLIFLATLAVIHSKRLATLAQRALGLFFLAIIIILGLKIYSEHKAVSLTVSNRSKSFSVLYTNQTTIAIDQGALSASPASESWITFTLIPAIVEQTGSLTIDHLIIPKINKRVFEALLCLEEKVTIKNIYIPWWRDKIPFFAWKSYAKLKEKVVQSGGKVSSINKKRVLPINPILQLSIEPDLKKTVNYYCATYNPLIADGICNKKENNG